MLFDSKSNQMQINPVADAVLASSSNHRLLAAALDSNGRTAIQVATPLNRRTIWKYLLFMGRYETSNTVHQSRTSTVLLAEDKLTMQQVALKFMRKAEDFRREQFALGQLRDLKYFMPALHIYDGVACAEAPGFGMCIVLPPGTISLQDAILHEDLAGNLDSYQGSLRICSVLTQLGQALQHLHSFGIAHLDFKPANAMRVGDSWKLIDFDAAVPFGEPAGQKCSTLVAPPELLVAIDGDVRVRDPDSPERLLASGTYDVWSFGAVLFHLITGQSLFLANHLDDLDDGELRKLAAWDEASLDAVVNKIGKRNRRSALARHLLLQILLPDPSIRPTMESIVLDQFLEGDTKEAPCVKSPSVCIHADGRHTAQLFFTCDDDTRALCSQIQAALSSWCSVLAAGISWRNM
jgi:serine/threonine protein kinase